MATVRQSRGEIKKLRSLLMDASTVIAAGDLVMLNADGLAVPAEADTDNLGVFGVAVKSVTSNDTDDAYVEVAEGEYLVDGVALAQAGVAGFAFASAATTVSSTQATDEPVAGLLTEVVSETSGWLQVSAEITAAGRAQVLAQAAYDLASAP